MSFTAEALRETSPPSDRAFALPMNVNSSNTVPLISATPVRSSSSPVFVARPLSPPPPVAKRSTAFRLGSVSWIVILSVDAEFRPEKSANALLDAVAVTTPAVIAARSLMRETDAPSLTSTATSALRSTVAGVAETAASSAARSDALPVMDVTSVASNFTAVLASTAFRSAASVAPVSLEITKLIWSVPPDVSVLAFAAVSDTLAVTIPLPDAVTYSLTFEALNVPDAVMS